MKFKGTEKKMITMLQQLSIKIVYKLNIHLMIIITFEKNVIKSYMFQSIEA